MWVAVLRCRCPPYYPQIKIKRHEKYNNFSNHVLYRLELHQAHRKFYHNF